MKRRYFCNGLAIGTVNLFFPVLAQIPGMEKGNKAVNLPNTRAVYGISSKKNPFSKMDQKTIPDWLFQHGINSVFVLPSEPESLLQQLKRAKIPCFQEFSVFSSRSLYLAHPKWRPITAQGTEMQPDEWYHGLCPNQPELRKQRLQEFEKRLQNPWIKGIWLDFIRYPVHWEKKSPRIEDSCFCPVCLSKFQAFSTISLPSQTATKEMASLILEKYLPEWIQFRCHSITSWVAEAKKLRDRIRSDIQIGLFLIPWVMPDDGNRMGRIVGQDIPGLTPLVDVFSPMVYHRMCGKSPQWISDVVRRVKQETTKQVWPVVQAMSLPDPLSSREFKAALEIAAESAPEGVIIFSASHLEKESRWEEVKNVWINRGNS